MRFFGAMPKSTQREVVSFHCDGCGELRQIEVDPRFRDILFDGSDT
jgi:hypothetical protein